MNRWEFPVRNRWCSGVFTSRSLKTNLCVFHKRRPDGSDGSDGGGRSWADPFPVVDPLQLRLSEFIFLVVWTGCLSARQWHWGGGRGWRGGGGVQEVISWCRVFKMCKQQPNKSWIILIMRRSSLVRIEKHEQLLSLSHANGNVAHALAVQSEANSHQVLNSWRFLKCFFFPRSVFSFQMFL